MSGFAVIYREVVNHPLFRGNTERLGAWTWLIMKACWKPTRFNVGGKMITLERGQYCASMRDMAEAWGWSKSSVKRFLDRLQTETMIGTDCGTGRVIITICNYDKYQDVSQDAGTESGTQSGTELGQQRDIKEQGNQETKDKVPSSNDDGRDAPQATPMPSAVEFAGAIFRSGLIILKDAGHNDRHARSIIGRWRKTYSDGTVLAVLARCQTLRPSEPLEWIVKALQAEAKNAAEQAPPPTSNTHAGRASVSEIGAGIAARKRRERETQETRIAIGVL